MSIEKNGMNGFQIFASILFALAVLGSVIILANGDDISIMTGIMSILGSSILFYFMYALGEIIKQLRISNNK